MKTAHHYHFAFTSRYEGISRRLVNKIMIGVPEVFKELDQRAIHVQAFWDTGATGSVIDESLAQRLKLPVMGRKIVKGVHSQAEKNTYYVNLYLPNRILFDNWEVTEGELHKDIPVLIGMDIMNSGDFAVTNVKGKTIFSFRIPSYKEIDFVPDAQSYNKRFEPKPYKRQQMTVPKKKKNRKKK